jgi:hypothetical protein
MRYDTPIFFQSIEPGKYNADTGDYEGDKTVEIKRFASVTDSGVETLKLIYGGIKQGSKVLRLQTPYSAKFESIRIGSKVYNVDFSRNHKIFVVSEVQGNAKNQN